MSTRRANRWFARLAVAVAAAATVPAQQDLATLVDRLGSTDAAERSQAYSALIRERRPEVVALLKKRIATFPTDGQQYAIYLLQQQPIDATRELYTQLLTADAALLRVAASAMLVRHGDRTRLPVLSKAIAAATTAERQPVLNAIHGIEDASVADAVRGYLTPAATTMLAASAFGHLQRIEKGRSAATDAAARALAAVSNAPGRAAALAWLAGGDDGAAAAAELAPLLAGNPNLFWTVDQLFEADRKYPPALVEAFAAALAAARSRYQVAQLGRLVAAQAPELAAKTLRGLLDSSQADLRTGALEALAAMPGGLDGKDLRRILQTGAPEQQLVAAALLRRMDDPAGLPATLALARQPGPHRAEAVRVLAGFRHRDVVPTLLDGLDDADAAVRQAAWQGLPQVLRDLFPYRRFDFEKCGYDPNGAQRSQAIAGLRAWWAANAR